MYMGVCMGVCVSSIFFIHSQVTQGRWEAVAGGGELGAGSDEPWLIALYIYIGLRVNPTPNYHR